MIKVYSAQNVYSQPLEFIKTSTQQSFAINQLVKIGSTGAGGVENLVGTTGIPISVTPYITMSATTGSSEKLYPMLRVLPDVRYIIDHCTSETVRSTTDIGLNGAVSSSGGLVLASTGCFKVEVITNTSDTSLQKMIGTFVFI